MLDIYYGNEPEVCWPTPYTHYEELRSYFLINLPKGVTFKQLDELACIGIARCVVEKLGGVDFAQIYWVDTTDNQSYGWESHAYVVLRRSEDIDLVYCSFLGELRNVGYVKEYGEDITDEIMNKTWDELI